MRVEQITHIAVHLPQIKSLGRANAETLGFLPDGAFDHYASRDWILVALDDLEVCIGYLLYRVSSRRANIVHLCVSESWRNKGVARALVGELDRRTQHLTGVGLRCRRDYKVNSMWPKLGFSPSARSGVGV